MSDLILFDFDGEQFRSFGDAENPMFVAADVCAILGQKNVSMACRDLDEDEKGIILTDTLGGEQSLLCVTESGLYSLVMRSRKPQAKMFRKWVTSEVIPSIRKTGSYTITPTQATPVRQLAPQRDLLDYLEAAKSIGIDQDPILKSLFSQRMAEQLGGSSAEIEQPIVLTVRANELGISQSQIGSGSQLGKYIATQFDPIGKTQHGRYQVNVFEPSIDLDQAILEFFAEEA